MHPVKGWIAGASVLSQDYDNAIWLAEPSQADCRGARPFSICVEVAAVRLLVRPGAVDKRFDGIALHGNGLTASVDSGRRGERPFALDLVRASLGLSSAARDDKAERPGQAQAGEDAGAPGRAPVVGPVHGRIVRGLADRDEPGSVCKRLEFSQYSLLPSWP